MTFRNTLKQGENLKGFLTLLQKHADRKNGESPREIFFQNKRFGKEMETNSVKKINCSILRLSTRNGHMMEGKGLFFYIRNKELIMRKM